MPEQIIRGVAELIISAQTISVRSVMIAKALQAIELVLSHGADNSSISQQACLSGLEILKTMHYQQALIDEDVNGTVVPQVYPVGK